VVVALWFGKGGFLEEGNLIDGEYESLGGG
jgi:hypothetical protein